MTPGRFAQQRVLLQADFDRFARLSGDDNPIHCDPAFAAASHFGATVAHGMLLYSCLCKALGEQVGCGTVQLEQSLMFPNPTFAGDLLSVELVPGDARDGCLEVATEIAKLGQGGAAQRVVTATGACLVVPPDMPWRPHFPPAVAAAAGDAECYGLRPGMRASSRRTFGIADLDEYGDLSGDRNPLFRDDAFARGRGFRGRIVPWPLLAGMFSDLLGTRLPGRGTGWMKQALRYPGPAYPGKELTAEVTVTRLRAEKELANLATRVIAADGRIVCDGEALVLVRNLADKEPKPQFMEAVA